MTPYAVGVMDGRVALDAMADDAWEELGVRRETREAWKALAFEAFDAALAQGDGFGPSSARHHLPFLTHVASTWKSAGLASAEGLRWHRAGFGAGEAAEWLGKGVDLDAAAVAAGHRMVG